MSQATRRNGQSSMEREKIAPESDSTSDSPDSPDRQPLRSTSRPSPYILLIYPIILAIGSLFSVLSPSASPSTYSVPFTPGVASDINTPQTPPTLNYFAEKQNILNLYFVKIGWFWTTLAFVLLQATTTTTTITINDSPSRPPSRQTQKKHHNLPQALLRYSLITLSWIVTTQWFFGPALVDRSFTSTGGRCIPRTTTESPDLSSISTGLSCKFHNGTWLGGHDISGHFFMLVLSSAFLFLEFFILRDHTLFSSSSSSEKEKKEKGGKADKREGEEEEISMMMMMMTTVQAKIWTQYFVWTVIVLDAWMLLMTAIWFHTLFEKISGLALAALSVWVVYFLPRWLDGWRELVGGV